MEIADISQGGWLATDGGITADAAIEVIKKSVDRLREAKPRIMVNAPMIKRALVIGRKRE